jgi:hypothetical protein
MSFVIEPTPVLPDLDVNDLRELAHELRQLSRAINEVWYFRENGHFISLSGPQELLFHMSQLGTLLTELADGPAREPDLPLWTYEQAKEHARNVDSHA